MRGPRLLAIVLAGGAGGRLEVLTQERAKPALPFGGVYRLIDFPLSNCLHSGISDVWVLQQYEPHELTRQLANGRPWDLDRTYGGFRALHPYTGDSENALYEGNADALAKNAEVIADFDPDVLVVLSADHVYKLDYRDPVETHVATGAAVTIVTTTVERAEAHRFGTVETDGDEVTAFAYKPEEPATDVVTTEVFVYDARRLLRTLGELGGDGEGGLGDFGEQLLPRLVADRGAREHRLEGYWRDVGTIDSYWQGHMDLLEPEPPIVLDDSSWPIRTAAPQRRPARIEHSARIDESWISPGAVIRGDVARSVIGPGVVVAEGARVKDSVVFHDATIERGASLERAIVDELVRIGAEAAVGAVEGEITVVGAEASIAPGASVQAGSRVERESSTVS
jgi:glucose-1-phosphate adenylyltransferase